MNDSSIPHFQPIPATNPTNQWMGRRWREMEGGVEMEAEEERREWVLKREGKRRWK